MILNPTQLTRLRDDHPHVVQPYISIMIPDQVYCGRISVQPARGDTAITVANEAGNIANVIAGQQVLVSAIACGARDKGIRRLRSRVGQVLTVDQNGTDWAMGDYLSVMEYWEPRPRLPYINDTSPYTIYKDEDIVYDDAGEGADDANIEPTPVAIMGPPWAGFLDGPTVVVQLDGSDSYAVAPGATISTYAWASTGGVISNAAIAQPYITFNAVGTYWVDLTVTDDNGKTQITRRPFFVHDRTTNAPYRGFDASIKLSTQGGAVLSISALDEATTWPEGTLVVLWCEEQFNTIPYSIGGFNDREHVKFVGYISNTDDISIDVEDVGGLRVSAVSVDRILSSMKNWSIALADVTRTPTTWYEYNNLNVARAVHHLWKWHSTLFEVADVYLPISNTLRKGDADFPEGDLLQQARQLATDKGIFALIGCDKQGAVHVEIDPNMITEANRAVIDTVQAITTEDWVGDLSLLYLERLLMPFASMSGIYWDGAGGTPYISIMPGNVPEAQGSQPADEQYQMLASQTDCNQKVGLLYAKRNNNVKEVRFRQFAGNYTHVDVFPQEFYTLTLAAATNKRGVSLDAREMIPRDISIQFNKDTGVPIVSAVFEPETVNVVDGIPGQYPTSLPTEPAEPEPPKFSESEEVAATLVAFTLGDGVYWSRDTGLNWVTRNGDRAGAQLNDRSGYWDPWGPNRRKQGTYFPEKAILFSCGVGYIYRSVDGGRHWHDVTPTTDPPNSWGDSPAPTAADLTYEMGVSDWHINKRHFVIAWWQNPGSEYRGWLLYNTDDGASWTYHNAGFYDDQTTDVALAATSMSAPFNVVIKGDYATGDSTAAGWYLPVAGNPFKLFFTTPGVAPDGRTVILDWMTETVWGVTGREELWVNGGRIDACGQLITTAAADVWENGKVFTNNAPPCTDMGAATQYNQRVVYFAGNTNWVRRVSVWDNNNLPALGGGLADEIRPICVDIGKENGDYLYITTWEYNDVAGAGAIVLRVYDVSGAAPVLLRAPNLGASTRAQFEARTYWAGVRALYDPTVANYDQRIIVYGRFNAGNDHVLRSSDAGATRTDIGDSATWGADWIGAAVWVAWDTIYICRNGGSDQFIRTINGGGAWPVLSALPFEVEHAICMHGGDATVVLGQRNGTNIRRQAAPYTGAWVAITPGGAAATRIGAVLWVYNIVP